MVLRCLKYRFEAHCLFYFHSSQLFHLLLNCLNFELMSRHFFMMEFQFFNLPVKGFITYCRLGFWAFESFKELAHLNRETIKLLHQYHPVSVSFGFFICLYLRISKFDFIWIYSFLSIFPLFFYLFDTLDTFHFNLMNSFSFIFRALLLA